MKIVISGSRTISDYEIVKLTIIESPFNGKITQIISGGCNGVDILGEKWAKENNIPVKIFLPDWRNLGKSAGPIRNKCMILEGKADGLILIWDGKSKGSKNMKRLAENHHLSIYERIINGHNGNFS